MLCVEPGRGKSVHQRLAHYSNPMEAIHARADPLEIDEDNIPLVTTSIIL